MPHVAFDEFDKAPKDRKISPEEFEAGCAALDPAVDPQEAGPLFRSLDKDGSGGVTPEEFFKEVGGPDAFAKSREEAAAEELKRRLEDAFGNSQDAWEAMGAGPEGMTPCEW